MYSRLSFVSLLLALCAVQGVLSVPLDYTPQYAGNTPTTQETENKGRVDAAKALANKNIKKMDYVLNNPAMDQTKKAELVSAAFGGSDQHNIAEVKDTVKKLKDGKVTVNMGTAGNTIAYTDYDANNKPVDINFGKKFHAKGTSDQARASTFVHEAVHKLKDGGDFIDDKGKVLPGSDPTETKRTGYATGMEPKKKPADLKADANWNKLLNGHKPTFGPEVPKATNLHKNSESYGQFAAMCEAAVPDSAVGLRRRADEDWDAVSRELVRRAACALPKNYFAKKAAAAKAKKAAEAKKGKTPAVNAKSKVARPSKNTKGTVAKKGLSKATSSKKTVSSKQTPLRSKKVAAVSTRKSAAKKPVAVGKGTKKVAAVGSRRPATRKSVATGKGVKKVAAVGNRKPLVKRPLAVGKAAKKVGAAGTRKPLAKKPVVSKKAVSKKPSLSRPKKTAAGKKTTVGTIRRPVAKARPVGKQAGKKVLPKKPTTLKKSGIVAKKATSAKKAPSAKRPVVGSKKSQVASKKVVSARKPTASKKTVAKPKAGAVRKVVPTKKTAAPSKANVAKPKSVAKKAAAVPPKVKKPVAQKKTAVPKPPAPKVAAKAASKKGRRELEFEY